uniref:Uncharacterized protein n=1 Tax=Mucochytrium quahogii TaxID=96639 RepID=A0A7S2RXE2_9STRA|mmetsp:Transcript_6731/g.10643  ORF Transcript_6731/g.10643 Transcript_6731/m.10643 type:complete len:118 (-) Transcript_6731:44-397(-)|eukprot:CAMPEP_0203799598 /NCGR_PEP_ID=MMETSP0100_2-20121128/10004_1 /ASSEMBLY_ACC=CAM_ASM_000210 /TAXON_ID=96639 /ORGANISM=" , Strain NY0313808BC1" /LENGTH=117 /DNA_ID=CAMNT_0050705495 /DNA_START=164 /DNA_END=514 /DNA_ORIENTATION=-
MDPLHRLEQQVLTLLAKVENLENQIATSPRRRDSRASSTSSTAVRARSMSEFDECTITYQENERHWSPRERYSSSTNVNIYKQHPEKPAISNPSKPSLEEFNVDRFAHGALVVTTAN